MTFPMIKNLNFILLVTLIAAPHASAALIPVRSITSPDGSLIFTLECDEVTHTLLHSVTYDGRPIVNRGAFGLDIADLGVVSDQGTVSDVVADSIDRYWTNPFGERSAVPDQFKREILTISHTDHGSLGVKLEVRVYDDGVAFRYNIEGSGSVAADKTSFPLPSTTQVWTSGTAQGAISKKAISSVSGAVERPVLAELASDLYAAIGEAGLVDSSRMKFTRAGSSTLVASLAGNIAFTGSYRSPWRFVRVAPSPGQMLEGNHFMLNLCDPSEIADTSWIRPGKVLREVTLTTQGSRACIDFAVAHDLKYILLDAGWYGPENNSSSDATKVNVDPARSPGPLDLAAVIAYGKTQGVGVILYVNQTALSQQLDEILPLYQAWGVAGIKFGFVSVGSQTNTRWLHEAVRKCAQHQLIVDIHDEYRPTGVSRTFPNLLTQEGIRGDEESPTNAMVLNTVFTRGLAGAGDHTNCYFASRVDKMGSHASQLAKSVCLFSPLQFLYWYDRPPGSPAVGNAGGGISILEDVNELKFFDRLPTTWDETRVINGYPGSHATVARRKGEIWFLGALNGDTTREFNVPLEFLKEDQNYKLELYRDDTTVDTTTKVKVGYSVVNRDSRIQRTVLKTDAFAAILTPTSDSITEPDVDPPSPPVPPGMIQFEASEGYPAAEANIASVESDPTGRGYWGTEGWSYSSSSSPGRVVATADSGEYRGGQAFGTNGTGTYIGGKKSSIFPAAACALAFDAQFSSGISVGFMADLDGDGLFDSGDTGMGFGAGGATTVRFQRRAANFGTENASPLGGSNGHWYRIFVTIGKSHAGSRPITMAVRNLTNGDDLDFNGSQGGVQPWSFDVTDGELGPAPEIADGIFVRLTGEAKIDNLRATIIGTPFQRWLSGFPALAAEDVLTASDPDHDGIPNLLEWVLDGNPEAPDPAILPRLRQLDEELVFTFSRRDDTEGVVNTAFQLGKNLTDWTDEVVGAVSGVTYSIDEASDLPDKITFRLPLGGEPKTFVRLRAIEIAQ